LVLEWAAGAWPRPMGSRFLQQLAGN